MFAVMSGSSKPPFNTMGSAIAAWPRPITKLAVKAINRFITDSPRKKRDF
jgi:hypothetical protein